MCSLLLLPMDMLPVMFLMMPPEVLCRCLTAGISGHRNASASAGPSWSQARGRCLNFDRGIRFTPPATSSRPFLLGCVVCSGRFFAEPNTKRHGRILNVCQESDGGHAPVQSCTKSKTRHSLRAAPPCPVRGRQGPGDRGSPRRAPSGVWGVLGLRGRSPRASRGRCAHPGRPGRGSLQTTTIQVGSISWGGGRQVPLKWSLVSLPASD